jgi:hypothetical protein
MVISEPSSQGPGLQINDYLMKMKMGHVEALSRYIVLNATMR